MTYGTFYPEDRDAYNARVEHHKKYDIPAWQFGSGDWFTVELFKLMTKADSSNFARLAMVFPAEAEAFEWWQSGAWEDSRRKGESK